MDWEDIIKRFKRKYPLVHTPLSPEERQKLERELEQRRKEKLEQKRRTNFRLLSRKILNDVDELTKVNPAFRDKVNEFKNEFENIVRQTFPRYDTAKHTLVGGGGTIRLFSIDTLSKDINNLLKVFSITNEENRLELVLEVLKNQINKVYTEKGEEEPYDIQLSEQLEELRIHQLDNMSQPQYEKLLINIGRAESQLYRTLKTIWPDEKKPTEETEETETTQTLETVPRRERIVEAKRTTIDWEGIGEELRDKFRDIVRINEFQKVEATDALKDAFESILRSELVTEDEEGKTINLTPDRYSKLHSYPDYARVHYFIEHMVRTYKKNKNSIYLQPQKAFGKTGLNKDASLLTLIIRIYQKYYSNTTIPRVMSFHTVSPREQTTTKIEEEDFYVIDPRSGEKVFGTEEIRQLFTEVDDPSKIKYAGFDIAGTLSDDKTFEALSPEEAKRIWGSKPPPGGKIVEIKDINSLAQMLREGGIQTDLEDEEQTTPKTQRVWLREKPEKAGTHSVSMAPPIRRKDEDGNFIETDEEWEKKLDEHKEKIKRIRQSQREQLSGDSRFQTKKSLDLLLSELGIDSDTIVKEDTSEILQELNKKDKRLLKTLLQLANPTEYFNEDVLKLGELITMLKSLGVVNNNKKLKKKVLKYEDENLNVVKRAVRLRREYEKLYKSIREVIYPKTGDDDE